MQGHEEQGTDLAAAPEQPAANSWLRTWRGAAVVAVGIGIAGYAAFGGNSGNSDGGGAIVACHDRVESRLKSPGTASYSGESLSNDAGRWTLTGSVDSQNSFGGVVRNNFTCVATGSGDNWSIVSLTGLIH